MTDDQAETLDWLHSMIELHEGLPRFKPFALSVLGISDSERVPDISIRSVTVNQSLFYSVGRQILALTIVADGGDAPLQFAHMSYYIGFTDPNSEAPPALADCIRVTPEADGANIKVALFIGVAEGSENLPVVALPAGKKKVWLWTLGIENTPTPSNTITTV